MGSLGSPEELAGPSYIKSEPEDLSDPPTAQKHFSSHYDILVEKILQCQQSDQFTDFTFLIGDSKVRGHKVVLSAFSNIIANNKYDHLELKDTSVEVLMAMINFIYQGEVKIQVNMLQELIDLGQQLEVKVLQSQEDLDGFNEVSSGDSPAKKRRRSNKQDKMLKDIKEKRPRMDMIEKFDEKKDPEFIPSEDGTQFVCAYCFASFRSKLGVSLHVSLHTGNYEMFKCFRCDYQTRIKSHLRTHCMKKHGFTDSVYKTLMKTAKKKTDEPAITKKPQ